MTNTYDLKIVFFDGETEKNIVDHCFTATKKTATKRFEEKVNDLSVDKKLFDDKPTCDYAQVTLSEVSYVGNGTITDKAIKSVKIYNPDTITKRKVICIIEVDDETAQALGIGPLDYLEKLLEPVGHIKMTKARVIDEDDLQDAKAFEHVDSIFSEEF